MWSAFPTANGLARNHGDEVTLDRDPRDSTGERWYWHIQARSAEDARMHFRLARPGLLGRYGPSVEAEEEYRWLWPTEGPDAGFTLTLPAGAIVRVCATLPYGAAELRRFLQRLGRAAHVLPLTFSERGRAVPLLRFGGLGAERLVVLTARHHACEAMASYVLEGAVEHFLDLIRRGHREARRTALLAVPFVDVDGVERGDQGKARHPWDHNRDYGPTSRYRGVAALRTVLHAELRPIYALDLHTPGLRGEIEEVPYVVSSAEKNDDRMADALLSLLAARSPEAPGEGARKLVFDQAWNHPGSTGERCCAAWLRSRPQTRMATTVEFPNAVLHGQPVTTVRARAFGAALLDAVLAVAG